MVLNIKHGLHYLLSLQQQIGDTNIHYSQTNHSTNVAYFGIISSGIDKSFQGVGNTVTGGTGAL